MSMVSDALKKAQAQATLGQAGLRLDLTGVGGEPPRRGVLPVVLAAAVVIGALIGVAVPAGLYVARSGGEAVEVAEAEARGGGGGTDSRAMASGVAQADAPPAAAADSSNGSAGAGPILAVEPFRDGGGALEVATARLAGELDPRLAANGGAGAGSRGGADAAAELTGDRGAGADEAGAAEPAGEDREPDRPRPALEAEAEYRGVLDVAEQPRLELSGIVWSQFTKIALINGSNAEPGDIVDGLRLVEIEAQRIRLRTSDGTEFYLRLR